MGFRLRRSARLGPLRFHFTASGLSSISVGGRGASLNLPVNRRGGPRASVGIPGTGLSWSLEQPAAPQPRRTASSSRPAAASARSTTAAEALAPALSMASDEAPAPAPSPALPNSRRLRPNQLQALRHHCLELFEQQLFGTGSQAGRLWEEALISRLLSDPALGGRLAGQLALIETRQAMTAYLERSRSQDDLKRRCQRCLQATEVALRLCAGRGWLS
jgi:hypothetical protein